MIYWKWKVYFKCRWHHSIAWVPLRETEVKWTLALISLLPEHRCNVISYLIVLWPCFPTVMDGTLKPWAIITSPFLKLFLPGIFCTRRKGNILYSWLSCARSLIFKTKGDFSNIKGAFKLVKEESEASETLGEVFISLKRN